MYFINASNDFAFYSMQKEEVKQIEEKSVPVQVSTLKEEVTPVMLTYTGVVKPEEIKTIAFKSS